MGAFLFLGFFVIVSLALLRWLVKSCQVHWKAWRGGLNLFRSILLVLAALLHLVSIGAWLIMALVTVGAIGAQLSPGGPAPYFLMPWFTGFFVLGIANCFADSLNAVVRGDYAHLVHFTEDKKPNKD